MIPRSPHTVIICFCRFGSVSFLKADLALGLIAHLAHQAPISASALSSCRSRSSSWRSRSARRCVALPGEVGACARPRGAAPGGSPLGTGGFSLLVGGGVGDDLRPLGTTGFLVGSLGSGSTGGSLSATPVGSGTGSLGSGAARSARSGCSGAFGSVFCSPAAGGSSIFAGGSAFVPFGVSVASRRLRW